MHSTTAVVRAQAPDGVTDPSAAAAVASVTEEMHHLVSSLDRRLRAAMTDHWRGFPFTPAGLRTVADAQRELVLARLPALTHDLDGAFARLTSLDAELGVSDRR